MPSFLQWLYTRLFDPGCPFCDSPRAFYIRPEIEGRKTRFRCYRCAAWGDEYDLLKLFYPNEDYGLRLMRMRELRREYEADCSETLLPPGSTKRMNQIRDIELRDRIALEEFSPEATKAVKILLESLKEPVPEGRSEIVTAFEFAADVLRIAAESGLHPLSLAGRFAHVAWSQRLDDEHVAEVGETEATCDPETCMATRCRKSREARRRKGRAV